MNKGAGGHQKVISNRSKWKCRMKPAKKRTQKSPKSTTATGKKPRGFTDEERVAMRERVQELKAEARRGPRAGRAGGESAVPRRSPRYRSRIAPWPSGSMRSSK